MKSFIFAICLGLVCTGARADLLSVTVTGALTFQTETAPKALVHTQAFNNAAIIATAIFYTASSTPKAQLELAFDNETNTLEVVNKSDGSVLYTYAQFGSDGNTYGNWFHTVGKNTSTQLIYTDWEMPSGIGDNLTCTMTQTLTTGASDNLVSIHGTFIGGTDGSARIASTVQGTYKTGKALKFTAQ